ncbi:hypothetical protein [Actinomycetospora sp. CA-053990]|uniref:hypothetical protein n=1 Tax=Actinomycetospora sp. CA-053990 TaxID=3239891 RepID=UPI003D8E3E68
MRAAVGADALVGLRLAVDELAPWAGVTPVAARAVLERVAGLVDLVVPVRGSALSVGATRPDAHTPTGFLRPLLAELRVPGVAMVLAGSVVDASVAESALASGDADVVEMTRAQLADADLVALVRAGDTSRPCVLTNQECRARDVRNPRVSCTVAAPEVPERVVPRRADPVLVVGAGPAGLEGRGRSRGPGARCGWSSGPTRPVACCGGWPGCRAGSARAARRVVPRRAGGAGGGRVAGDPGGCPVDRARAGGHGRGGPPGARDADRRRAARRPAARPRRARRPLGDGAAVALAERLAGEGREVAIVAPGVLVGPGLARTGDLVDAQVRLARAGVRRVTEARVVGWSSGSATVADVVTGATTSLPAAVLVDAGPRRAPAGPAPRADLYVVGDAVAPRTVAEAVREGRAAAQELLS